MAHLVPNPPSAEYWSPLKVPRFSILTDTGATDILAWGVDFTGKYQVNIVPDFMRISCDQYPKPDSVHADLAKFYVRGLMRGDVVALYQDTSSPGQAANWIRISEFLEVKEVSADFWELSNENESLPKYKKVPNISFYPFGSMQRIPPMPENVWMQSVRDVLDKIYSNPLGRAVLEHVPKNTVIHPLISPAVNANSTVLFSPPNFTGLFGPGQQPDEILFHELIHVIEASGWGGRSSYYDKAGFYFDKTDFMSVNATNMYSCLLGRALRKDHHGFDVLPNEYFVNPQLHRDTFDVNYGTFKRESPSLYDILANGSNLWNPVACKGPSALGIFFA